MNPLIEGGELVNVIYRGWGQRFCFVLFLGPTTSSGSSLRVDVPSGCMYTVFIFLPAASQ